MIEPDKSFLALFFRNLMLGEQNELKNRYMLIGYKDDTPTSTPTSSQQVQAGANQFMTDNIQSFIKELAFPSIGTYLPLLSSLRQESCLFDG